MHLKCCRFKKNHQQELPSQELEIKFEVIGTVQNVPEDRRHRQAPHRQKET